MKTYWNTIISGTTGLIGAVLRIFSQKFSNWLSERKLVKEEFTELKNSIYATTITNNLFPRLLSLKQFIICHSELLQKQSNNDFFHRWLMIPYVEESFRGIGFWTHDKVKQMNIDLDKIEI